MGATEETPVEGRWAPTSSLDRSSLGAPARHRIVECQDRRFDGMFVVGVTSTGVYCRPSCASKAAIPEHCRFFDGPKPAEAAGYRACRRCRPASETAETRAADPLTRLAVAAIDAVADGALNGRTIRQLASQLGVSERHLRRCVKRTVGTSLVDLATTHRLLRAQALLRESGLSVSRVAYASGFQSLRRFNAAFRQRCGTTPGQLRTTGRKGLDTPEPLTIRLPYDGPFAWHAFLGRLDQVRTPGVEVVRDGEYATTLTLNGCDGYVVAGHDSAAGEVVVRVSAALVPTLVPLAQRLRALFDLDSDVETIERHLLSAGRGGLACQQRGIRLPGAFDGFGLAMAVLVYHGDPDHLRARYQLERIVETWGRPIETGVAGLEWLPPDASAVAGAGVVGLSSSGITETTVEAIHQVARLVRDGRLRLEPGADPQRTRELLMPIVHDAAIATSIIVRTLRWPDAFTPCEVGLQAAAGVEDECALERLADGWRPWRAYAAEHLHVGPARTHGGWRRPFERCAYHEGRPDGGQPLIGWEKPATQPRLA